MQAIWNNTIIADSAETIVVEGNHYFPPDSIRAEYFQESDTHSKCFWKGVASYKHLSVNGEVNKDAAWYYPNPKDKAKQITGYYAFWKGVEIVE
ncbi:MAG: DUF427 domain-containing protein [Gammaproteobacteria bacterium]|nr:DUF427 domain-containing protein [Gammaproteobacteria bacterium]NNC98274.1 DUF427 domain-containing protein [Gammaproteobacteria bacterium]NNM14642.1 DUF427 domain-containing protein [Gammaproteobacteria bacterium]